MDRELILFPNLHARRYSGRMAGLSGKFIVLDGGEGCGKSTQLNLLLERLRSIHQPITTVRDPGSTRIGERIRDILLNPDHTDMTLRCEMLLYMASRAQLMSQVIGPALERGDLVVSDRFVSSTLAYQLGGEGLSAEEILRVADVALRGRLPDLTIILDVDLETSQARVVPKFTLFADAPDPNLTKDRIEQRPLDYHRQVRENYLAQARRDPRRHRVVDAGRDVDSVHQQVWDAVMGIAEA